MVRVRGGVVPGALLLSSVLAGCGGGSSTTSSSGSSDSGVPASATPTMAESASPTPSGTPAALADRTAIARLVDELEASTSGRSACTKWMTAAFVAQSFGNLSTCESGNQQPTAEQATGGTVTGLTVSGDSAQATVTDRGGNTAGAHGTWYFVRTDGQWQLNQLGVDYLRSEDSLSLGKHYKSSGSTDPFANSKLRACIVSETNALDDADYRAFADGVTSKHSSFGKFFADCEQKTGVPSPFRSEVFTAVVDSVHVGPPAYKACLPGELDQQVDEATLVDSIFDGKGSAAFTRYTSEVQAAAAACAAKAGMTSTPTPTP